MSFDKLLNAVRQQASLNSNNAIYPCIGIVTSYNPQKGTVKVTIQPEDPDNPAASLSGDIPLTSNFVGNGWGLVCAPSIGDRVVVVFQEGYASNGFIMGAFWNSTINPPAAPSGEFWLVHQSGSTLKFTNDGNVLLHGNVNVNITANSNVNLSDTAMTDLKTLITSDLITLFNNHVHAGVTSGGDPSGPPTVPLTAAVATTTTKAN